MDETICKFCAEPIKAAAIKCRYCGEFFDASADSSQRASKPKVESREEYLARINSTRLGNEVTYSVTKRVSEPKTPSGPFGEFLFRSNLRNPDFRPRERNAGTGLAALNENSDAWIKDWYEWNKRIIWLGVAIFFAVGMTLTSLGVIGEDTGGGGGGGGVDCLNSQELAAARGLSPAVDFRYSRSADCYYLN